MEPISLILALAGLASSAAGAYKGTQVAGQGLDFQKQNLANALAAAEQARTDRLRQAGAIRQDQFGNTTYYDPSTGRWQTLYTPTQQRLLTADQARQERTLARGAQASEDYAKERAGFLYNQPPSEASIRNEIMNLLQRSQGQGERGLNTLLSRWGIRTAGNIPTLSPMTPGGVSGGTVTGNAVISQAQQLADTMLKARQAALSESESRQKAHAEEYLPAMRAFEQTANVVPGESSIGKSILGLTSQGQSDILGALADYQKEIPGLYGVGGRNVGSAYNSLTQASENTPKITDFAALINALKPGKTAAAAAAAPVTPIASGTSFASPDVAPDVAIPLPRPRPFDIGNVGSAYGSNQPWQF